MIARMTLQSYSPDPHNDVDDDALLQNVMTLIGVHNTLHSFRKNPPKGNYERLMHVVHTVSW